MPHTDFKRPAKCPLMQAWCHASTSLAKPIVAKILSIEITHKTEVGGVQLGIQSIGDLGIALSKLDQIPLVGERRYLLEEMAPPGVELIIGADAKQFDQ